MRLNKLILLSLLVAVLNNGYSQFSEEINYPDNYYLFPIKPGVQNTLAGTMGELRSSHFHTGLDIRTEGRTGLAVHAAADGFISRVAVSPVGYGNALYIQHPNGQTTVYAHLNKFTGELAEYVRREQYRRKTFKINLYFRKDQFKVDRGDTIAWSGNSGSSGGPHLHFDLRDENQRPLNPLKYGFDEVIDRTPPVALKLAVKTVDIDSRVDGLFGRKEYTLRRVGNNYVIDEPITGDGVLGFELLAHDKLDYTRFRCGINIINFTLDDTKVFTQEINSFAFSEQRNILRHMDYEKLTTTGKRYHKLYVDDGNELQFYQTNETGGKVMLQEEGVKKGKIELVDSYGNKSYVTFDLVNSDQFKPATVASKVNLRVQDNTLIIQTPKNDSLDLSIYIPEHIQLESSYQDQLNQYYLWDLRNGLPRSVEKGDFYKSLDFKDLVPSGVAYGYYSDKIDINFTKGSLFDTLYLETDYQYDTIKHLEIFKLGDSKVPLRRNISVTLKPQGSYAAQKGIAVFSVNSKNNPDSFVGGKWTAGKVTFSTRNFGRYTLARDTIPPSIKPLVINSKDLKFQIEDDLAGLKEFECYVDDEWVLMNYDYKRKLIWSEKLKSDIPFQGVVKLIVTDNVNNKTEYETKINL